jgi:hypothetical protein
MRYALLIYTEPGLEETLSDAEREAVRAEYSAVGDDARFDRLCRTPVRQCPHPCAAADVVDSTDVLRGRPLPGQLPTKDRRVVTLSYLKPALPPGWQKVRDAARVR